MTISDNVESKRIFIGFPIPREISTRIHMLETLVTAPTDSIRWVTGNNLHITLLFLGNIPDANVENVKSCLHNLEAVSEFELSIENTGVFPQSDKPRIFWMDIVNGRDSLISLQAKVNKSASEYSEVKDDQDYIPHLTIGRVGRSAKLWKFGTDEFLNAIYDPIVFKVEKFYLYMSELLPHGPKYTIIEKYDLQSVQD